MRSSKAPSHWYQWPVERQSTARFLLTFSKKQLLELFPDIVEYEGHHWTKVEIVPYILNSLEAEVI